MKFSASWFFATLLFCTSVFARDFHVSPAGRPGNPGTADAPFDTFAQARDAVRAAKQNGLPAGGITVWVHGGFYDFPGTLQFDAGDSGTPESPIVYAAVSGEQVHLTGARSLDPSKWSRVDAQSSAWSRLDDAARGNVVVTSLAQQGIHDFGSIKPRGFVIHASAPLELFAGGLPMTLGRWPNTGEPLARTQSPNGNTQFTLASSRVERWTQARDAWMHGLWAFAWADFHVAIAAVDSGSKTVSLANGPAQFGLGSNRPFYAYNLLEEIDQPGEYYLDRSSGLLYFWPREPIGSQALQVSMLEEPLLRIAGASHLIFRDFTIEAARGSLVRIDSGHHNRFERCLLRNAGQAAAHLNGTENGLDRCEILDCGEEGVFIDGGQRASLTPGKNYVTNSRIQRTGRLSWTYKPGISIENGTGNIASHNLLDDMPHTAILFGGNNQLIESNEIRRVCQQTSDTGAIYSGRGWGARGNVVRFNYIHHIETATEGDGAHGIYLDDGMSGVEVYGNVLYRIANTGIFCGGGRDNIIRNNLIAHCGVGHFNDDRVRLRMNNAGGSNWNLLERLSDDGIRYQSEPWASAYPALAAIPDSWNAVQQGLWRNPEGTVFSTNAGWNNNTWLFEYNDSRTGVFSIYAALDNNRADQPPLFDERASEDRSARPEQLVAALPGFAPIPFRAIGPSTESSTPVTRPPATPVISGQAVSDSILSLRWSGGGNLSENRTTGFSLERRAHGTTAWSGAGDFGPDVNIATVSGLAPASIHDFRVRAFNALGFQFSNVLTLATLPADLSYGPASRVEAENPLIVASDTGGNGSVGISDSSLDSGQSVRLYDAGDSVHITLVAPTAGQYRIGARVRAGGSTGPTAFWPDGYRFKLDGQDVELKGDRASLSTLDEGYGGCYWGTMVSATLTLSAGVHTLEIASTSSWAVADFGEIAPLSGEKPPQPPVNPPAPPSSTSATVTVPGTLTIEATSAAGASATFSASASDSLGNALTPSLSHNSGAIFPLGTTTVTVSANDGAGHTDTKTFPIIVRDTTPPIITAPADFDLGATSALGANVTFAVSAHDLVSGSCFTATSHGSGSFFPLGTTIVTVTATDDAHNTASKNFRVTVTLSTLATPAGLTASGWDSAIDLDWQPVPFATSYTLKRATSANGSYAIVATVTSPEFTDNSVANGITYFYTVSANNHQLGSGDSPPVSATPVAPLGFDAWTSSDVGSVAHAGRASFANGMFTITGSGADIWESVVAFQYVYQPLAGDGSITARVTSLQNTDGWAKAGVMIRESLDPGAAYAGLYLTPGNGAAFQWRADTWSSCGHIAAAASFPTWVRLTRSGNELTALLSADGANWTRLGTTTIAFSQTVYVGLAVTAHNHHAMTAATFTDVTIPSTPATPPPLVNPPSEPNTPAPPPLTPEPVGAWTSQDIGSPSVPGGSTQQNGAVTVHAAGSDIWGSYDQFHYVALPASGDCAIVARVASLENVDSWSKAGIMIRESLSPDSAFAGLYLTGANGMALQWRSATRYECNHAYAGAAAANWVSLTRRGNTLTAQVSVDGTHWTLVDVLNIPMAQSLYIGLATTSHHGGQPTTAHFDSLNSTP